MKLRYLLICIILLTTLVVEAQWNELGTDSLSLMAVNPINTICRDGVGNLYAAGYFVDNSSVCYVAKWNGNKWVVLGKPAQNVFGYGPINSICTDAAGNVYAAGNINGSFTGYNVYKWDGNVWSELINTSIGDWGLCANNSINSICVDSFGNIYAAGNFTNSSGNEYVAKWDGTHWEELGMYISPLMANDQINTLTTDLSGNIYAAGKFTNANGKCYVAKWDGNIWSELGTAGNSLSANNVISSVCIDNFGNVYAAGSFANNNGQIYVAKWDGTKWVSLGSGINLVLLRGIINSICTDTNNNLYAGGYILDTINNSYNLQNYVVLKWDGISWSQLGVGNNSLKANNKINTLCSSPSGEVYAAGDFTARYGRYYVSKWNGNNWNEVGECTALFANYSINSVCIDSSGNVYAGGDFINSNGYNSTGYAYLAKWDGIRWIELKGLDSMFICFNIFSSCTDIKGNVYIAGNISYRDSISGYQVVKWDGNKWSSVGIDSNNLLANNYIYSICTDHFGNIYAAGAFTNDSGKYYVAKWDGNKWEELGNGINSLSANGDIYSIQIDKSGDIYAAGAFTNDSGKYYVAKWDGIKWSEIGKGINSLSANNKIASLNIDISGNVYAGGAFTNSKGKNYVAIWDGTSWNQLGNDTNSSLSNITIETICSDSSKNIYVGGSFNYYSNVDYILKWDGSKWNDEVAIKHYNNYSSNGINYICTDKLGNIYAGGDFRDSLGGAYVGKYTAPDNITGKIKSVKGLVINLVTLNYHGTTNGSNITDSIGNYNLGLFSNGNYTITPTKNNDINKTNGVTTLDLALTQAHILGKNLLNSPYKIIAADVNGDSKVSTLDLVYMKRLILGVDTTFTNTSTKEQRLWAFVDSSYKFPDTTNPFPFKDSISYTGLNANQTNQTFIGIKLGDVNWDWNPAIARMPSPVFVRPKKLSVGQ